MRNPRRTIGLGVVSVLLALIALPAAATAGQPDSSGLVVRLDEMGGIFFEDPEDGLVLLTAGTAEEACTGAFEGAPLQAQIVETPTGALVLLVEGRDVEAWLYASPTVSDLCSIVLGGGTPNLLATGTVDFRITDNDLFASQTRTNSFGERAHGTLTGLDGSSWNVTAQFQAVVLPSDDGTCHCVHVRSDINLVARG
jgi:hypothetical protein